MSNKTIPTIHNNGVDKTFVWDFQDELQKSNNFDAPEGHVYELSKGELPSKAFTEAYYSPNSVFLKAVGERQQKYFNKKKPIDYSKAAEKALKRYNKSQIINVNFPYQYSYGYPGTHETYLYLGTLPDWPTQWPKEFVYGHEADHLTKPYSGYYQFLSGEQKKLLELNTNTVTEGDPEATEHDSKPSEKRADLQGMRALLYQMGLFNPSTDTEISMESIKKLREQYPDLRPVKQMDDETLYKLLNLVAYNSNKTKKNLQYAKEGVKLKYIKKFQIPAGAIENEDINNKF